MSYAAKALRQVSVTPQERLNGLRVGVYRFYLVTRTAVALPVYKGSTFRGAFGHALHCLSPEYYSTLFEPRFRPDSFYANRGDEPPKPFVLVPPLENNTDYPPGAEIVFDLVLFGGANDQLSLCATAFLELGRTGLGKGGGQYDIRRIEAIGPSAAPTVLHAGGGAADWREPAATTAADWAMPGEASPEDRLTVEFVTRARFKQHGKLLDGALPFAVFARRLLERLDKLADVHEGHRLFDEEELAALVKGAATVRVHEHALQWRDWSRYSGHQHEWMQFGGLLGRIAYEGPLGSYLPYLIAGQWTHVGGKTSFGLGRYRLQANRSEVLARNVNKGVRISGEDGAR